MWVLVAALAVSQQPCDFTMDGNTYVFTGSYGNIANDDHLGPFNYWVAMVNSEEWFVVQWIGKADNPETPDLLNNASVQRFVQFEPSDVTTTIRWRTDIEHWNKAPFPHNIPVAELHEADCCRDDLQNPCDDMAIHRTCDANLTVYRLGALSTDDTGRGDSVFDDVD